MPFSKDLLLRQHTKKWTFKQNAATAELQNLLDQGKRKEYAERLNALNENGRKFTRTRGVIYELFDEGETIKVSIRFKVKGSVINWEFDSPLDVTHQDFRDLVFNTAAKAHACVDNSCETYYRGTDHYHLIDKHIYKEEAHRNHNHYRTKNGPITPVEVYQHLFAFYAQKEGQQFISSPEERDEIILSFAMHWAEYNADIKYMPFLLLTGNANEKAIKYQLENLARTGTLTPEQASLELDQFFASEHGKNMLKLVPNLESHDLDAVKNYFKDTYKLVYLKVAPVAELAVALDPTLEPQKIATPSESSSKKLSPRDEYESSPSQVLDAIDLLEVEAFANDLTKHCQSVKKELLEDLELEDFRKGLLLYHTLCTVQQTMQLRPGAGERFHPDLTTDAFIKNVLEELPSLQGERLGSPLLDKLVTWIKTAPPELDKWVDWVKVNGSRGLGSEIGLVRTYSGTVDIRKAAPPTDRKPDDNIAQIDFDKVDMRKVFHPKEPRVMKGDDAKDALAGEFSRELDRIVSLQLTQHKVVPEVFKAKVDVINLALAVLQDKEKVSELEKMVEQDKVWLSTSPAALKSKLQVLVEAVFDLYVPHKEFNFTM